jgi:surface antigen
VNPYAFVLLRCLSELSRAKGVVAMKSFSSSLKLCVIAVISAGLLGCESKAGSGALIGGGTGALVGGVIGNNSHGRTAEGALIGGAIGAIGGGLVGHGMDKNDEKAAERDHERDYDRRNGANTQGWRESSSAVTKSEVITWTDQGVRDDIIIDRIDRSGTVFRLSAADQNDLRDHGVSESVIRAMKDTARR